VRLEALERGASTRTATAAVSAEEREARYGQRRDPAGPSAAPIAAPKPQQQVSPEVLDNGR